MTCGESCSIGFSSAAIRSSTAGATVSIQVNFSESVTVTGTPQLALNSGATVNYASGTGTSSLTFNYTVAGGETSADLDYNGTGSLTLNGGTIKDAATNNATLTLASPAPRAASATPRTSPSTRPPRPSATSTRAPPTAPTRPLPPSRSRSTSPRASRSPAPPLSRSTRAAARHYTSGSGSSTLTFNYTVGGRRQLRRPRLHRDELARSCTAARSRTRRLTTRR